MVVSIPGSSLCFNAYFLQFAFFMQRAALYRRLPTTTTKTTSTTNLDPQQGKASESVALFPKYRRMRFYENYSLTVTGTLFRPAWPSVEPLDFHRRWLDATKGHGRTANTGSTTARTHTCTRTKKRMTCNKRNTPCLRLTGRKKRSQNLPIL